MARDHFNPARLRIISCESKFAGMSARKVPTALYEHTLDLEIGDTGDERFAVTRMRLTARGGTAEPVSQNELARLMLDSLAETIQRERADIRPGEPSPAEWTAPSWK